MSARHPGVHPSSVDSQRRGYSASRVIARHRAAMDCDGDHLRAEYLGVPCPPSADPPYASWRKLLRRSLRVARYRHLIEPDLVLARTGRARVRPSSRRHPQRASARRRTPGSSRWSSRSS